MKKLLIAMLSLVAVILIAGYVGKDSIVEKIFPQAKGVIVYGEKQQIDDVLTKHAEQLETKEVYELKIEIADGQKIMYLSQSTIQGLLKRELLTEVEADGKTKKVKSLSTVPSGEGLLFAKKESDKINGNGNPISVKYEGNLIIGSGRAYVDAFVVLEDSSWSSLQKTEKTMAVMKFKENPQKLIGKFDVERDQLVTLK
ncbi:lipoprotein BA_5634 family protein [Paenibacillus sp. TAF43_2]|uniref:lipoprotein BA_5634 family protein n=1 Tax=Paenibacillus sp. TAF43_2 TaxID=3233069 RepID=UPI003F9BDF18